MCPSDDTSWETCPGALPLDRFGLYVHFPFCANKCAYCDFNSVAGHADLVEPYLESLCREARTVAADQSAWLARGRVSSVYFGGGTPSLMTPLQLARVIETLRNVREWEAGAEVTVEASPGTINLRKLSEFRALGCNRISFGVQSFEHDVLCLLGRRHNRDEAAQAVRAARLAGFGNISLDLIYGVPRQSRQDWRASLEAAIALEPEHLSLYCLTLEAGTPLALAVSSQDVEAPDEDTAAAMYEDALDLLAVAGYEHYELSNWARPGLMCRHNLGYWECRPYIGLGAGAHSCLPTTRPDSAWRRAWNPRGIREYMAAAAAEQPEEEVLGCRMAAAEYLMLGLRLARGVAFADFQTRFGMPVSEQFGPALDECARVGLTEEGNGVIRLTRHGLLFANEVSLRLVAAASDR